MNYTFKIQSENNFTPLSLKLLGLSSLLFSTCFTPFPRTNLNRVARLILLKHHLLLCLKLSYNVLLTQGSSQSAHSDLWDFTQYGPPIVSLGHLDPCSLSSSYIAFLHSNNMSKSLYLLFSPPGILFSQISQRLFPMIHFLIPFRSISKIILSMILNKDSWKDYGILSTPHPWYSLSYFSALFLYPQHSIPLIPIYLA